MNNGLSEADFNTHILGKYCSKGKGLTLKGFKEFFKNAVMQEPGEQRVREWLAKLGYDSELYSTFSRSFILTMHSDLPLTV